ncbi:MAG: ATP-binding cassette domain-containing protein [Reichenbachiella sp.]
MISFELHKSFLSQGKEIELNLSADWSENQIIAIFGKSGVGKSSLLRMLAGLMQPDQGHIKLGDHTWYDSSERLHIKSNKRPIGFLPQDYSLFPNMDVLKNIKYGLKDKNDLTLVNQMIDIAGLGDLLQRMPANLSGGQQQRVALVRALVRKPKLLLLDEPLSALDNEMRIKLQEAILTLKNIVSTTIVFVSHHLPEVFKLADQVMVIEEGVFTKQGTPSEVFFSMEHEPNTMTGEVLAVENHDNIQSMKVLVDGKIVLIQLPK